MSEEPAMFDSDELLQRFVDQELSEEERLRFVVRLGTDAALRQQLIDLERVVLGGRRLPPPVVPDSFVAAVMDRTAFTLCMENDMPIMVFDMFVPGNIERAVRGEDIGTWVV